MATGGCDPVSHLSGEVLEKAKLELKEDPDHREEVISELRLKIEEVEGKIGMLTNLVEKHIIIKANNTRVILHRH